MIYVLSLALVFTLLPVSSTAEGNEHDPELWSAVKPLDTTVTFLNIGAHPDDERSDFLAYLSRGLGVKTASLIANRGEGGQNEIGLELGDGLGIIRSREMIEAAKITGVKAYHLSETTSDSIYDFGFSKTKEETLDHWGEDLTYERLIRFIRTYQPDIIMPSFRDSDTQHGHHRTMTILSEQTFKDAADPTVFPNQLKEGLSLWQTKKLYLPAESKQSAHTSLEIGMLDPVYGKSYPQIGEQSRYMHKSQGMGNDIPVAPRQIDLELKHFVNEAKNPELFAGIPYDFNEWATTLPKTEKALQAHYSTFQQSLERIISSYPTREDVFTNTQKALKDVNQLMKKTKQAKLDTELKATLLHKLQLKKEQLLEVSVVSSNLDVKAVVDSTILTKGQQTSVKVTISNNGKQTLRNTKVELVTPKGWKVTGPSRGKHLRPDHTATLTYHVHVPNDAENYHAYKEPVIQANVSYEASGAKTTTMKQVEGTIAVLPDVGLTLSPEDLVINTANVQDNVPVTVKVKNYRSDATSASVSLQVPDGWKVSPKATTVTFKKHAEEQDVTFTVQPPATIEDGAFTLTPKASVNGQSFSSTVQEIHYDHIGTFYYLYPANVNGVAFELLAPKGLKVGYVESGFDKVADYLTNAGLDMTKLTQADLSSGDLSQYDSIVIGIRAYLSRVDLAANNERLKEYVKNGGHLVVQYHKPNDNWDTDTTAPYRLKIGNPSIRWRVTDENATVNILKPESPLFNTPNKLTNEDWANWIQERGLYYPMEWANEYETFVSMADPNEQPFDGGILMAKYGKGTYLYTNLVFYRQIQGQVPGGYRIFTNIISYGHEK